MPSRMARPSKRMISRTSCVLSAFTCSHLSKGTNQIAPIKRKATRLEITVVSTQTL